MIQVTRYRIRDFLSPVSSKNEKIPQNERKHVETIALIRSACSGQAKIFYNSVIKGQRNL